jgi:hypothetical protein
MQCIKPPKLRRGRMYGSSLLPSVRWSVSFWRRAENCIERYGAFHALLVLISHRRDSPTVPLENPEKSEPTRMTNPASVPAGAVSHLFDSGSDYPGRFGANRACSPFETSLMRRLTGRPGLEPRICSVGFQIPNRRFGEHACTIEIEVCSPNSSW